MKKVHKIGDLINYERKKLRISVETLASGLCSKTVLRRIEAGERDADFFLLDRLLGRLGSSINKIEILQDIRSYELLMMREYIAHSLAEKDYFEAERFLNEYEHKVNKRNNLQKQYLLMIKAILEDENKNNKRVSEEYFNRALKLTLPRFEVDRLEDFLLSEEEVILILLSLKHRGEKGENLIRIYGRLILHYVDTHFLDEDSKSILYSQISWVIGDSLIKKGSYEEALEVCIDAEKRLTGNGILLNLPQLLDRILFLAKGRDKEIYADYSKMRIALKGLYDTYGIKWNTEEVSLLLDYKQRNIYIISEFLKQERRLRGCSQLKLSEHTGVDHKTISRIERGKTSPKNGTMKKLLSYFNLEIEVIEARIVTNSFYLLELEREVAKLSTYKRYEEAEEVYRELKQKLSYRYKKNRQYVEMMDAIFDWKIRKSSSLEIIQRLKKAFRIIRGDDALLNLGNFVLSRTETFLLNNIAICFHDIGENERSIELLERVKKSFENSKVDLKLRYIPLSLIYTTLSIYYEESNQFEKAIFLINRTIAYALECKRGDFLGFLLEEKTYTEDRMSGHRDKSKTLYRQSYQLRKLMKESKLDRLPLRKIFRTWYGEEIE